MNNSYMIKKYKRENSFAFNMKAPDYKKLHQCSIYMDEILKIHLNKERGKKYINNPAQVGSHKKPRHNLLMYIRIFSRIAEIY